jgi:hypothetical protein
MARADGYVVIMFFAVLCVIGGFYALNWVDAKYREHTRYLYLAWWLLIFLLFFLIDLR